ncbi:hypothetical protein SAMN05192529_1104 [Arachidicoccus rhizosphaerae]|uniref:Rad52/22 family double-strand break repair protein n=1 Tax=Arachidicoccus rhizosphaerae TaxID=551991 RepID=A0A1H3Z4L2_9BACT|nr:hypothetical protein [Arachidicoccus rhizosphaerae]SEA18408.1 hypothetical protein SAMN05192529_1104 [Arachidicoccus rhizosphaerae]
MAQLPTLKELHQSPEEAFKNDQFRLLLNQEPHITWIKKHPLAKAKNDQGQTVPAEYLPIDKIESLLDYIFQDWYPEILSTQALFNSITVTVRVHLKWPTTGEWRFYDGVGAATIQVDKGSMAGDLSAIKASAVQMAAPSAKSYAIKDACEHLGKLFGRDLNRRDTVMLAGAYSKEQPLEQQPAPQVQYQQTPVQAAPQQYQPQAAPQQQAPPQSAPQASPVQQSFSFNPANL